MNSLVVALYLYILINYVFCAHDTTCSEDQKHFAEVCFTPTPRNDLDLDWFLANQPQNGWFSPMGNDIHRLHFSEILQGKHLTLQDNFQNSCFRVSFYPSSSDSGDILFAANMTGYENKHGTWECKFSKDTEGLQICNATTDGPSKYHENFNVYPIYTDNKNVLFSAFCFSHGQAGWSTLSTKPELTEDEVKIISEQVKELGFSFEDHVATYDKTCSN